VPGTLKPLTRETRRETGEVVREFDLRSTAVVLAAVVAGLFLLFFLAASLPWVLSKGMTAAVEGLMSRLGFGDFTADTIWDWFLVLLIGAVFTAFVVAVFVAALALYNLFSTRTGYGLRLRGELRPGSEPAAVTAGGDADDAEDSTFDELYAEAQRRNIPGRSSMSKSELRAALRPKRPKRRTRKATTERA
jgi:hypothetical protein